MKTSDLRQDPVLYLRVREILGTKKSCMDYGFHMAITKWDDTVSKEMEIMVKDKGHNSISLLHFDDLFG